MKIEQIDWRPTQASAAKEAFALLSRVDEADAALALAADVVERATTTAQQQMAEMDPHFKSVPVCGEGCAYCCHQSVVATTPEVVLLVAHLRETLNERALAELAARVRKLAAETGDLTVFEWYSRRIPCPLLDVATSACTAHDVRPLRCRAFNSLDVMACMSGFDDPKKDSTVPNNAFQQGSFEAAALGSSAAMAEAGKDPDVYDLTQALAIALEDPTVAAAWGRGEKPLGKAAVARTQQVNRRNVPIYQPARKGLRVVR